MSVSALLGNPKPQFFVGGLPADGYRLFFYAIGTSTKQNTYTDSSATTTNSNPITLDAEGYPTSNVMIYGTDNTGYKIVMAPPGSDDPPTSPTWTIDKIYTTASGIVNTGTTVINFTATAGQTLFNLPSGATYGIGNNSLQVFLGSGLAGGRLRLTEGEDYTETSSSSFTLNYSAIAGDYITVVIGQTLASPSTLAGSSVILTSGDSLQTYIGNRIYNVKDAPYSAIGDGLTDDTSAFVNAALLGHLVFIPNGTYLVDPEVIKIRSGGGFIFESYNAILKPNSAGKILFNEHWGSTTKDDDITIIGGTIDCTGFTGTSIPTIAIAYSENVTIERMKVIAGSTQPILVASYLTGGTFYPSKYCTVTNCIIEGSSGIGIGFFGEVIESSIINNRIYNVVDDAIAIDAETSTAVTEILVTNNIIDGVLESDPKTGNGIFVGGVANSIFSDNIIKNTQANGISVVYGSSGSTACSHLKITNNVIIDAGQTDTNASATGYGILLDRANYCKASENIITNAQDGGLTITSNATYAEVKNNQISYCDTWGIQNSANKTAINDNYIHNNAQHGIFNNGGSDVQISGNTCYHNNTSAGSYYGIDDVSGTNTKITDNTCYDDGVATQDIGINRTAGTGGEVSQNTCYGNVTANITPQTDTDSTIRDNIIDIILPLIGSFTASAASTYTVTNGNVLAGSHIEIVPTNGTARTLVTTNGYFISRVNLTSFTVNFGAAAAGTETFTYKIS